MTQPLQPLSTSAAQTLPATPQQVMDYWIDGWQRAILFWDVLRQRTAEYEQQRAKPVPNVLSFDAELLERPVNYLLVRIKPPAAASIDPRKRPSADNPLLQWQTMVSDGIIAALDGWRDLRDRSMEQMFLGLYSAQLLQALGGLCASDAPPRRHRGMEPERLAFIQQRIAEIKGRLAEGGLREAGIRSLVHIGLAGPGVDERAFNELRRIRAQHEQLTLEEFKRLMREQFSHCCSIGTQRSPPSRRCCRRTSRHGRKCSR